MGAKLKRLLERYGLYCFLLPVFFVLHVYLQYYGLISTRTALLTLAEMLGGGILFFLLLLTFTRNVNKSLQIAAIWQILFLFYGVIKDFIAVTLGWSFPAKYIVLLPVLVAVAGWLSYRTMRKKDFSKSNFFQNILILVFIAIDGLLLLRIHNPVFTSHSLLVKNKVLQPGALPPAPAARPDVYYLLFDCYPGTAYLRGHMQFDNSGLDSALQGKGFHLIGHSTSNYRNTALSIPSILNFEYLDGISSNTKIEPKQYNQALLTVKHAIVPAIFTQYGYRVYNLSIFDIAGHPAIARENFLSLPDQQVVLYNTLAGRVKKDILWNFVVGHYRLPLLNRLLARTYEEEIATYSRKRDYNNTVIDSLLKIPSQPVPAPKFVYAHFYLPHPPFFYDMDGRSYPIDSSTITAPAMRNKARFLSYLRYTNRVMLKMVDTILRHSARPPVIIVQSDHGFRDFEGGPPFTQHDLFFKNYSAFYFPNKDYSRFYDTMSNINTFPVVFDTWFGARIPLQRDSSIF